MSNEDRWAALKHKLTAIAQAAKDKKKSVTASCGHYVIDGDVPIPVRVKIRTKLIAIRVN